MIFSYSLYKKIISLLLSLKKVCDARLGESFLHHISPKTPATQYQQIEMALYRTNLSLRNKRKGKQ